MNPLRLGSWAELGRLATPLRMAVFVDEQGVPAEMELDDDDPACLHAVVVSEHGEAVATGRLLPVFADGPDQGLARIGRMAVQRDRRGTGLGAQVLDRLLMASRTRGDIGVVLHAQCRACGFYAGRGFTVRGEVFDEGGIEHIEMVLRY
ncbi:GNAT family N-acetyltransferase [Xylophilus sp. Kf1]|nr:GNAT family N-acetyltransferase [Xylophilus sp. Kf1]